MGKIIKRQIKRSMPWLTILALLSFMVSGLVFNLDFNLVQIKDKLGVNVAKPEAQANDTATTSVTVRNAPPEFTTDPAENPISSSTSPINVGENISFTGTASDPETSDYFLLICDTDAATAHEGTAPTCDGVQFCRSASTTDDSQASCTYNNITDPLAETDVWYAFVCDGHLTEAECSTSNQGSGDEGSPFYVNHRPSFSEVNTTVDNQPPGGTFTITASTTDNDTAGGADLQHIAVCGTNSWATSSGCAVPYCTGTSTAPADPSCSFATSTPARDGAWGYWAFVMDGHFFSASSTIDNPRTNTYTVTNVAPVVDTVSLTNDNTIWLELKNSSNGEFQASTTMQITDNNGCPDITQASSSIYWENAPDDRNCPDDDDMCYQIATTSCETVAGTCDGWHDAIMEYTCSTTMVFHAQPTDASSNYAATVWYGGGTAWDEALSGASSSMSGVEVVTQSALDIQQQEIPYGSIAGGQDSASVNATTTIENYGNSPIDLTASGTDMWGPGTIEVYNQKYGLNTFTFPAATYTLYSSTTQLVDIVVDKPTSSTVDVEDDIYWGIGIPGGKVSGNYYGTNTLIVQLDGDGW